MINLEISLFYHLKQKAGASPIYLSVNEGTTVQEIKNILEQEYPRLTTQLDNVMILKGKKIILEDEVLQEDTKISFLTPIGGG
jgi:molybdopterin converting factor small subunit